MAGRVEGKVAIITGGGSGMGRAGSVLLAAEGAKVVIGDVNETAGKRVVRSIQQAGAEATFVQVDVRDVDSVPIAGAERRRAVRAD